MITVEAWLRRRLRYPGAAVRNRSRIMQDHLPNLIRLLLVDPDPEEASRIVALLPQDAEGKVEIFHAADVASADILLAGRSFDAVLLDMSTSIDLSFSPLDELTLKAANIPIIVLTQTDDETAGRLAVQAGAQDYLIKSRINGDILRRVIRYSIDRVRFRQDVDGLARDIAHRQRIADALSDSQNRMMAINESLYEGVLVFDENGHIALSNRAADRLLGSGEKLISLTLDQIFRLKIDNRLVAFVDGPLRRVISSGQGMQDDDAVIVLDDGQSLAVAYACTPLMEKDGVQGAILSLRDIGSFKQAQREALQASKLASVGQLAAGIAHEINTPIQYIGDNLGFLAEAFQSLSTLLQRAEELLPEPAKAALNEAKLELDAEFLMTNIPAATRQSLEGVAQVARIVLAMKEFSHPGERIKAEEDINRAIENTLAVSRNEWKQSVTVETRLAADLPRVHCLGGEINQVFLNLIINATHAVEEAERGRDGKISITTRRDGDMVEIVVEDNGIGMTEETRGKIFDPFFTTKRVGKGTGQGLAICRDVVVAKHGGRITVDSSPGVGTSFSVMLPINASKSE